MVKRSYFQENQKIIKLVILISMGISFFAVYLDVFVLGNTLLLTLADASLFLVLTLTYFFYNQIINNYRTRQIIVAVFPLVYFPLSWLGSSGNHQIGVLYFFLFSSVMIFINPTRIGFLSILALLGEMIALMAGANWFVNPGADSFKALEWVYLLHLAIVGFGNTFILYNIIVKNKMLFETVYHDSNKDFLTNSYNRRYLDEYFEVKPKNVNHLESGYLFFCDLDRFKLINDRHGHEMGDRVLQLFSQVVTSQIRTNDLFGRYGGDEFVIIVNDLNDQDVPAFKRRIQEHFAKQTGGLLGFEVGVTIGVSKIDQDLAMALTRADQAMYQSKKSQKAS